MPGLFWEKGFDILRARDINMTKIIVNFKRGLFMKTMSLSEAKMKLSEVVENVHSTDQEVVITKNGRPAAVIVSPDEFEGWKETLAIKSDAGFMDEIKKGLIALKKSEFFTLEELFK